MKKLTIRECAMLSIIRMAADDCGGDCCYVGALKYYYDKCSFPAQLAGTTIAALQSKGRVRVERNDSEGNVVTLV